MATALSSCGLSISGTASTAASAIRIFSEVGADIALIDLDLGSGPTGIDLARELRKRDSSVGLIILTSYDDPRLLDSSLTKLPPGTIYLRKRQVSSIKDVQTAIEKVLRAPNQATDTSEIRSHNLTDGNFALLRDIARGLTNVQIAEARGITVSAVEKSIRRLSDSLGISETSGNHRALLIQSYLRMTGRDVRS